MECIIISNLGTASLLDKAGLANEVLFLKFLCVSLSILGLATLGTNVQVIDKGQIVEKENQTKPIRLQVVPLLYSGVFLVYSLNYFVKNGLVIAVW
ncbi:hypothetical protein DDB_G0290045 [Dictyostelium discoideum AX4]|uniref:Uncharacterized protein n=1 Tax=Dictyostelium discoideum TaxID=44689 RepID=Q54GM3_DICDI|nr:hypothetical protein DDB_G0290045 [Dictyostelium discoideum AX4]EAL62428.1 hypothetical protein DDB_G0290045 [Dictyostelium discoideum AX4]|eukprot:XP_635939.1 hypothetical protein DDB_G0290045 [Dictyostelium discoideum AX4]